MKADQEKNPDKIIRSLIKEGGIDEAPQGFTNSVMQAIHSVEEINFATVYKPLISKTAWAILGIALVGLFVYMLTTDQQAISIGHYIPFSEYISDSGLAGLIDKLSLNGMGNINIHSNMVYALMMLPFFFLIQIYFLQRKKV